MLLSIYPYCPTCLISELPDQAAQSGKIVLVGLMSVNPGQLFNSVSVFSFFVWGFQWKAWYWWLLGQVRLSIMGY